MSPRIAQPELLATSAALQARSGGSAPRAAAVPDAALEGHLAIVGVSGSGKTFAAKGCVERLLDLGRRVVVTDPTGVWHGLRTLAAGDRPGYPIPVLGGRFGDSGLRADAGAQLGRMLASRAMSAVLDLSELTIGEQRRFMAGFAEALYQHNREPLHLVIDETDEVCLSKDTELLGRSGWLRHDQLDAGTEVVCFDLQTESYSYGPVERVIRRQHDGDTVRLKTKSLDCLATPNYRTMLRRIQRAAGRYGRYPWTFCPAGEVPTCVQVPFGGAPIGPGIAGLTAEVARIIGWALTDGSLHNRRKSELALCIHQSEGTSKNGVQVAQIMHRVLTARGASCHRRDRGERYVAGHSLSSKTTPAVTWHLGAVVAAPILSWLGGTLPLKPHRRVPR